MATIAAPAANLSGAAARGSTDCAAAGAAGCPARSNAGIEANARNSSKLRATFFILKSTLELRSDTLP